MAQLNPQSTSTSSPSSSAPISYAQDNHYVYDIFINHRGPDCKATLATDLYNRLCEFGYRVFLDQRELQEGDDLTSQIKGAIRKASVSIAIFSPHYAESNWCLDELLLMFESKKTILPVFYDGVKPSDVRWVQRENKGVYARALRELENKKTFDIQTNKNKPRYPSDTMEKWREVLSVAADISGFELENYNGDQHQIFQRIVEAVVKRAKRPVYVAKYPIGLAQKVRDFEMAVSLKPQSSETRVIGIVGLGGVGKTTLANEIFNRRLSEYDRSCHLSDVSGIPLETSQSNLLRDLARCSEPIANINEGIRKIKEYLPSPRALVLLDNVDHINQLEALLVPMQDRIHPGSLILITSRNRDVLINSEVGESSIYRLEGLNQEHSQELFCCYAFGQPIPVAKFEGLVQKFLVACRGLPLSLRVIGASLSGYDNLQHWEARLSEISKTLPDDIKGRLKFSYDGLNKEEKHIFLDIASFFIGEDSNTAVRIWDGSGWNGWLGFQKLQNRCLIEVDSENRISMHDHLRDLGRDIEENEPPHRIWRLTDDFLYNLLQFPVRGIDMVPQHGSEWLYPQSFKTLAALSDSRLLANLSRLQLLRAKGNCVETSFSAVTSAQLGCLSPQLVWLCWDSCPFTSLPSWIPLDKLRVLQIKGTELQTLWSDENQAPLQLRELIIDAPLSQIPNSIGKIENLEKLVLLQNERVEEVNLETFLNELCQLKSLKCLVLKNCSNMKSLPDSFVNLTNLEHINLSGCSKLQKLPNSFGKLQNLQLIDLSGCLSLKTFPPRRWKRKNPPRIE